MLFCGTPIQSVTVGLVSGILGGIISIWIKPIVGIAVAVLVAYMMEIVLHEIREDKQYEEAKQEIIKYLKEK